MIANPVRAAVIAVALVGCSKKSDGLPPSTEWQADTTGAPANGTAPGAMAMGAADPQALPPGQPGDVTGQARVKVPADTVALALDTVLP